MLHRELIDFINRDEVELIELVEDEDGRGWYTIYVLVEGMEPEPIKNVRPRGYEIKYYTSVDRARAYLLSLGYKGDILVRGVCHV